MNSLHSLTDKLKEGLPDEVSTLDDRIVAALANQKAIIWCAESAKTVSPELKQAVASIYRQVEYRGGPDAKGKASAAFLRIFPDEHTVWEDATSVDFRYAQLVDRGLPADRAPANGKDRSVYFRALRSVFAREFPDGVKQSLACARFLLSEVSDLTGKEPLRFNEMTGRVLVDGEELGDEHLTALRVEFERRFKLLISKDTVADAVLSVARTRSYHPVRDYLQSVKWDGTRRLDHVASDLLNAEPTPINGLMVRRFFIQCVARAIQPGCKCDDMLILQGEGRINKSTFFRALIGDDWFSDHAIDFDKRDDLMVARRAWVVESAEMRSFLLSSSDEKNKASLSRQVDEYREPWGRFPVRVPRHFVVVGTGNIKTMLRDPTGNLRYWPVTVRGRIDLDKVRSLRDQLWAEAFVAFDAGERWWLDTDENAVLRDAQGDFEQTDSWDEPVTRFLDNVPPDFFVTLGEVANVLGLEVRSRDKRHDGRIRDILEQRGWTSWQPSRGGRKGFTIYVRKSELDGLKAAHRAGTWSPDAQPTAAEREVQGSMMKAGCAANEPTVKAAGSGSAVAGAA
jgi:predicted P-loop ATPase